MTPHDPLNAPAKFLARYEADQMTLPGNFMPRHPFDAGVHDIRDEKLMKRPLDPEKLRARLARYYALITHTDAQIGRILAALEESGHADNTIVVFSSDNGLALGSHGLTGKQNLYEASVKVPLVLSGPGIPRAGRRRQLCYLYEIYPTLCELAGIAPAPTVQFRSLVPVIREAGTGFRDHLSFAFMQWQRAVRDERFKLIEFCVDGKQTTRLFDLQADPLELKNLAETPGHEADLKRLRALLEKEGRRELRAEQPPHIREMSRQFWKTYHDKE